MTSLIKSCLSPLLLCALYCSADTDSQQNAFKLSGQLDIGQTYSTNLSIIELEQISEVADTATVVAGRLNLNWQLTPAWTTDIGYYYSSQRYRKADEYNLQLSTFSLDTGYSLAVADIGVSYFTTHATLAHASFLNLNQFSLYGGKLLGQNVYLRAAVMQTDKTYLSLPGRDADNQSLHADLFWFLTTPGDLLNLGYFFEQEDAVAKLFNYTAHNLKLGYTRNTGLGQFPLRLRAGWRLSQRHYANDIINGQQRQDIKNTADINAELALKGWLALILSAEFTDYQSDKTDFNYDQSSVGLSLRGRF